MLARGHKGKLLVFMPDLTVEGSALNCGKKGLLKGICKAGFYRVSKGEFLWVARCIRVPV